MTPLLTLFTWVACAALVRGNAYMLATPIYFSNPTPVLFAWTWVRPCVSLSCASPEAFSNCSVCCLLTTLHLQLSQTQRTLGSI